MKTKQGACYEPGRWPSLGDNTVDLILDFPDARTVTYKVQFFLGHPVYGILPEQLKGQPQYSSNFKQSISEFYARRSFTNNICLDLYSISLRIYQRNYLKYDEELFVHCGIETG